MLLPFGGYTRKSSREMAGVAKLADPWLELRFITYNGAAKAERILRTI